jgi:hypothetical protein
LAVDVLLLRVASLGSFNFVLQREQGPARAHPPLMRVALLYSWTTAGARSQRGRFAEGHLPRRWFAGRKLRLRGPAPPLRFRGHWFGRVPNRAPFFCFGFLEKF